jgi:hypothetical protein
MNIFLIGLCEIEQTEKGWYITLIDKDPDSVKREIESDRKEKMDLDDEQRRQKLIAEQVICKRIFFIFIHLFRSKEIKKKVMKNLLLFIRNSYEKMKKKKVLFIEFYSS